MLSPQTDVGVEQSDGQEAASSPPPHRPSKLQVGAPPQVGGAVQLVFSRARVANTVWGAYVACRAVLGAGEVVFANAGIAETIAATSTVCQAGLPDRANRVAALNRAVLSAIARVLSRAAEAVAADVLANPRVWARVAGRSLHPAGAVLQAITARFNVRRTNAVSADVARPAAAIGWTRGRILTRLA